MKESIALFCSFLLLSRAAITTPPPANAPSKQHSIKTVCHATRAIYDHFGKVAKWQAHCHVEIWAGKDQPVFGDLTPEGITKNAKFVDQLPPPGSALYDRELPETSAAPVTAAPKRPSMNDLLQGIQFLVDEARLRHHECMESKASILHNFQQQLPSTLKSKEDVLAVINNIDVGLPPGAGLYIGHMDDFMKEKAAELHAIEHDTSLSPEQKSEALKQKRIELRGYLDGHCQGAHPSIAHHDVTQAVPNDLHKMQVSMMLRRPGNQVEILHLPQNAFEQRTKILESLAGAALHHTRATGEYGSFTVHGSAGLDPEEERQLRAMAGHNYFGPYQLLHVPRTFIVQPHGEVKKDSSLMDQAVSGVGSGAGVGAGQEMAAGTSRTAATDGNGGNGLTNFLDASQQSPTNAQPPIDAQGQAAAPQPPVDANAQPPIDANAQPVAQPPPSPPSPATPQPSPPQPPAEKSKRFFSSSEEKKQIRAQISQALTDLLSTAEQGREAMKQKASAETDKKKAGEIVAEYYDKLSAEAKKLDPYTVYPSKELKQTLANLKNMKTEDLNAVNNPPSAPPAPAAGAIVPPATQGAPASPQIVGPPVSHI